MRQYITTLLLWGAATLILSAQNREKTPLHDSGVTYIDSLFKNTQPNSDSIRLVTAINSGNIEDYRVCFTTSSGLKKCYKFNADSVFRQYLVNHPADYEMHKLYGDLLFEIFNQEKFGKQDDNFNVARRMNNHYTTAWRNGNYDAHSLYAMGYYCTLNKDYANAAKWYSESLAIDSLNPLVNYSMGVSHILAKNSKDALPYSLKATELYTDSLSRSDASRMAGIALYENELYDRAYTYFAMADSLAPGYLLNRTFLLRSMLKQGKDEEAISLANTIFTSDPHNPDVADRVYELFRIQKKQNLYEKHIKEMTRNFKADNEALGNLEFHYGKSLFIAGNNKKAIRTLKQSRNHFKKSVPENHQVFEALEDMLIKRQHTKHQNNNRK